MALKLYDFIRANRNHSSVLTPATLAKILGYSGMVAGTGTLVNGRSSSATIISSNSEIQNCNIGEVRYNGARRVHNLCSTNSCPSSFDFTLWTKAGTTVTSLNTFNFTASSAAEVTYLLRPLVTTASKSIRVSAKVSTSSGTKQFRLKNTHSAVVDNFSTNFTATVTKQIFSFIVTNSSSAGNGLQNLGIVNGTTAIAGSIIVDWIMVEDVTGLANKNFNGYIDSTVIYNAGINGVKYFDTTNANTVDGNGVVTETAGTAISPKPVILAEPTRTNYFLQSSAPATQTIALSAGTYTISVVGPGSITLSSGATGTVTSAAPLTFTTSGSTVFTVSGSLSSVQVELAGDKSSSYIPTTTVAVTRSADSINIPYTGNFADSIIFAMRISRGIASPTASAETYLSATGRTILAKVAAGTTLNLTDGTNTAPVSIPATVQTDYIFAFVADAALSQMAVLVSGDGGATWTTGTTASYDGSFNGSSVLNLLPTIVSPTNIIGVITKSQPFGSITAATDWIKANSATELS